MRALAWSLLPLVAACGENADSFGTGNGETKGVADVRYDLDPYGLTPLTAVVSLAHPHLVPDEVTEIRFTLHGVDEAADLEVALDPQDPAWDLLFDPELVADGRVGFPLFGLFPNATNRLDIWIDSEGGAFRADLELPVGEVPDRGGQGGSEVTHDEAASEPGWPWYDQFLYDESGGLRWTGPAIVQVLDDGTLLSNVDRIDRFGGHIVDRDLPDYLRWHHDTIQLPGGTVAALVDSERTQVVNADGDTVSSKHDVIVELAADGSDIVNLWDLRAFLDVDRIVLREKDGDWAHANTLHYEEAVDALHVSARYQGIVSLTRGGEQGSETNAGKELRWIFAPHLGWGEAGWDGQGGLQTADYLLTAVDSEGVPYSTAVQQALEAPPEDADPFWWPIAQHGLQVTERHGATLRLLTWVNQASVLLDGADSTGNITAWGANGDFSNDRSDTPYSLIAEYEIDEDAHTVRQVWAYGEGMDVLYGSHEGSALLGRVTGNRFLVSTGYDQADPSSTYHPSIVELDASGEVISSFTLDTSSYSAFKGGRTPLYAGEAVR